MERGGFSSDHPHPLLWPLGATIFLLRCLAPLERLWFLD